MGNKANQNKSYTVAKDCAVWNSRQEIMQNTGSDLNLDYDLRSIDATNIPDMANIQINALEGSVKAGIYAGKDGTVHSAFGVGPFDPVVNILQDHGDASVRKTDSETRLNDAAYEKILAEARLIDAETRKTDKEADVAEAVGVAEVDKTRSGANLLEACSGLVKSGSWMFYAFAFLLFFVALAFLLVFGVVAVSVVKGNANAELLFELFKCLVIGVVAVFVVLLVSMGLLSSKMNAILKKFFWWLK